MYMFRCCADVQLMVFDLSRNKESAIGRLCQLYLIFCGQATPKSPTAHLNVTTGTKRQRCFCVHRCLNMNSEQQLKQTHSRWTCCDSCRWVRMLFMVFLFSLFFFCSSLYYVVAVSVLCPDSFCDSPLVKQACLMFLLLVMCFSRKEREGHYFC